MVSPHIRWAEPCQGRGPVHPTRQRGRSEANSAGVVSESPQATQVQPASWAGHSGHHAEARWSQKQRAGPTRSALPRRRRCGPAAGTEESVTRMVSQIQPVEYGGSPVSRMQLESLRQTQPVRPRCHQPGTGRQSAAVRQTDHWSWAVRPRESCVQSDTDSDYQAVMARVISQT